MIRSLILVLFVVVLSLLTLRSLRAQRLKERYVLLFLTLGLPVLLLVVWPDAVVWAESVLQIEKATLLVMALGVFTVLLLLKLLSIVSVQQRQIAALAQLTGILLEQQNLQSPTNTAPRQE